MSVQPITINLPETLYRRVAQRAKQVIASVEDEVVAVVASGISRRQDLPAQTVDVLAQLDLLNDKELWRASRMTISLAENKQMQKLLQKQQIDGLNKRQQTEARRLLQRADHVMLLRSKAIALLSQRGYDVSDFFNSTIAPHE